jgi:hypothetical protein
VPTDGKGTRHHQERRLRTAVAPFGIPRGVPAPEVPKEATRAAFELGDELSPFCHIDNRGQIWNSMDHIGTLILVVYFYAVVSFLRKLVTFDFTPDKITCENSCGWD